MGQNLIAATHQTPGVSVAAGSVRPGSDMVGRDVGDIARIGPLGVLATDEPSALFEACDVVIDFTAPALTFDHIELARRTGTPIVVGTTGLDEDARAAMAAAGSDTVVVFGANMSLGVNLLLGVTRQIAAALDEDFDIEIVEMHHRFKKDAPSGTALALGAAAAAGRGVALDEVADRGRDGVTGERKRGAIGFAALRGGDVIGDHNVIFAADGERIEIGHRSSDRTIYVRGAIKAAVWTQGREPGFYGMADVLGLA